MSVSQRNVCIVKIYEDCEVFKLIKSPLIQVWIPEIKISAKDISHAILVQNMKD